MSIACNIARLVVDNGGALSASNLANAPNPILPGTVAYLGMNSTPTGWLKANGAAVSRTTYAELFSAIGTTYGIGNGSTTFNLPDLRGEFPRGWDDGRGIDSGRAFGSSQDHAVQSHVHNLQSWYSTGGDGSQNPNNQGYGAAGPYGDSISTRTQSGNTASETRPRNVALLACIKF